MSDNATTGSFGFNAKPADNASQRAALSRELQFAKGFTLLFALCNDAIERDRQIAALRQENPDLRIQEIPIRREVYHLRDILRAVLDDPVPDLVCVYGMENWVRSDSPARTVPFLLNLNAGRNNFYLDCPCPILFWVPEYLYALIAETAPDFVSVRSGMYVFASPPAAHQETVLSAQSLDYISSVALTLGERQQQIEDTGDLLARIRALPEDRRDPMDEARTLTNLAMLYLPQGRYDEAEKLLKQSIVIKEFLIGREHPDTARTILNLAMLYVLRERFVEAETLFKESLSAYERKAGSEHPDTTLTLLNLAQLYSLQNRFTEAETLYKKSLSITEHLVGRDHLDTARVLHNLASLYIDGLIYDEAEPLLKEAIDIKSRLGNREHPTTGLALYDLARLYVYQGKYADAEPIFEEALAIVRKFLHPEHPLVIRIQESLTQNKQLQGLHSP